MTETEVRAEGAAGPSPCGSYGAAQRHRKRGEPLDEACREAEREYMRGHRSKPGASARDKWWNRTYDTALRRLAAEYPERFREVLADVRTESGSTPWDPGEPS